MTTHKKTARELVSKWVADPLLFPPLGDLMDAIAAALSRTEAATLRRAAEVAEAYRRPMPKRPTIQELEAILAEPDTPVEITPDGEIRGAGTSDGKAIAQSLRALAEETRHEPHE